MTRTMKLISLLLLTSMTIGAYDKKCPSFCCEKRRTSCCDDKKHSDGCKDKDCCRKSRCDDKKHSHRCKDRDCCRKSRSKCCEPEDLELAFESCLSFEQVIDISFRPRPENQKPEGVCGTLSLCFEKDLSKVHFKLVVFGAKGEENIRERITSALLFASLPGEFPFLPLAELFNCTTCTGNCGTDEVPLIRCGTLTNDDLIDYPFRIDGILHNGVVTLYAGCRSGKVKAVVYGGDRSCMPDSIMPAYGFLQGGILAGTCFAARTNGL